MDSTFTHLFKLSEGISLEFSILSTRPNVAGALASISKLLRGALRDTELKLFLLAIDEVLQNAYEHGNLEISNQEKKILLENDQLDIELKSREQKFSNRKINIQLNLEKHLLKISVTDEGQGFDWRNSKLNNKENTSLHERGLSIIQAASDKIEFNDKGNSITLHRSVTSHP